ncbi:copper amine oxidase [Podospora australis]|uniref:Amine oxidase n=1 Tax=Podospora australis TaxID=1536484 RepID=A0AAN7AKR5_9PEZI|nr:copper amine oxidase [Podospora australis]
MGIIKKVFYTTALAGTGTLAYLGAATTVLSPLPDQDPIWRTRSYAKYNRHYNSSTQDVCLKRIPLSRIKPELLQREGDLALEFCRGVWGGLGYRIQRWYLARKYQDSATASQLWSIDQLSKSRYEPGTIVTDHFEVVEKNPTEIIVRCGDTPRNSGPRDSDGLFVISAAVDKKRGEVVLALKSCFFNSAQRIEAIQGPMPGWIEELHRLYSRILIETASWKLSACDRYRQSGTGVLAARGADGWGGPPPSNQDSLPPLFDAGVSAAAAQQAIRAESATSIKSAPAPAVENVSSPTHPLGPLSPKEISQASGLVKAFWPEGTSLHFKAVTLLEPEKKELAPYLTAARAGESLPSIDRKAFVIYSLRGTHNAHEAIVNLTTNKVERNAKLGPFQHANADGEELMAVEKFVVEHPAFQAELAKLKLPEGAVIVIDPWIYGSDGVNDGDKFYDDKRVTHCFVYMRDPNNSSEEDSCHYSFPLPISPVVDPATMELIRIDIMPTGLDETVKPLEPYQPRPANEYIPEAYTLRSDVKPLQVVQPEGASFTVEEFSELGRTIKWQKWDFKVGFNQREGMVLYDICYDNKPLFFRLSLSDMAIPYADPRHPFHRKCAFDLGDAGAGTMANNLQLGCDCLGSIYYISGVLSDSNGQPQPAPNVICVHEQDAGILYKHTNYRTNRAVVARNRELVLQTILTVSNYEYILSWVFNMAGDITYEARATGILSTQPVDLDLTTTPHPYGTIVHPGVLAAFHQHFFSLRVDPMVAGHGNKIVYDEAYALPRDDKLNPHGVGYTTKRTEINTSGGFDLDVNKARTFKIINPAVKNSVNGASVGYKVHIPPMQPMLADTDSFHYKRAEFADRSVYVTKYAEDELFSGGKYTNQSRGGTGVRAWADRKDSLEEGDPVLWVNFGINHIPRVEDFPLMPVETMRVMLRPVNFFDKNPALDVPPSKQENNCSVSLNKPVEQLTAGVSGLKVGGGCCGSN